MSRRAALPDLIAKRQRAEELAQKAPRGSRIKRQAQLVEATHRLLAAELKTARAQRRAGA